MLHAELIDRVTRALSEPLPGQEAQARMAPPLRIGSPSTGSAAQLRHAAGLLLVFPVDQAAHLVLTVRSSTVRHAGQVSLPGGVIEPGESVEHAALREAREEIGCATEPIRLLGRLTPLDIPVSGFRLHPVVGAVDERPVLTPSDHEVARILEVPLDRLLRPHSVTHRLMQRGSLPGEVPVFETDDVVIWGATAMVLAEFLTLLGWSGPPTGRS